MPALPELLPALADRLPRVALGTWPTPLELASASGCPVWIKREDLSAPHYAGNKIRPLELVFGAALAAGKRRIWATGAFGSNHALATLVHAPRHGLEAAAILWPQGPSATAAANLEAMLSSGAVLRLLRSIAAFPAAAALQALVGRHDWVMPPGAATPLGALGHAGAAVELAAQLAAHGEPAPRTIVLASGSTCTTVGMLVGTALAATLGLAPSEPLPLVHAVRVTPWPVTCAGRIVRLAERTVALLAALGGPRLDLDRAAFRARLVIVPGYLGAGYGQVTSRGLDALTTFASRGLHLDTTYTAKAAAYLLDRAHLLPAPVVFWASKSSQPLPPRAPDALAAAPQHVRDWLSSSAC